MWRYNNAQETCTIENAAMEKREAVDMWLRKRLVAESAGGIIKLITTSYCSWWKRRGPIKRRKIDWIAQNVAPYDSVWKKNNRKYTQDKNKRQEHEQQEQER